MTIRVPSGPATSIAVDGATVVNRGPDSIYYRDELPCDSTSNNGTLASGGSVILEGSQFITSAGTSYIEVKPTAPVVVAPPRPRGTFQGLLQVGTRQEPYGVSTLFTTPNTTGYTWFTGHTMTAAGGGLRLLYTNFYSAGNGPNSILVKAGIEYAGTVYPVSFNGNGTRQITIAPGEFWLSDPIWGFTWAKGESIISRTFVNWTTIGHQVMQHLRIITANGDGRGNGDKADSGAIDSTVGQLYGPTALLASSTDGNTKPQVCILGDSFTHGTIQSTTYDDLGGFFGRALDQNFPFMRIGRGGEQASDFVADVPYRLPMAVGSDYAVVHYGTNDRNASRTTAQILADLARIGTWLVRLGITPYVCTLPPRTDSGNTAPTTGDAVRVAVNLSLRTNGLSPYAGVFDTDATVGHPTTGLWLSNSYTEDGVHPSAVAHALMATAIDTAKFVRRYAV
jgi:lysophospholipase L1-like esterase